MCAANNCEYSGVKNNTINHFRSAHPHLNFYLQSAVELYDHHDKEWYMFCFNEFFHCRFSASQSYINIDACVVRGPKSQDDYFGGEVEILERRFPMVWIPFFSPKYEAEIPYSDLPRIDWPNFKFMMTLFRRR